MVRDRHRGEDEEEGEREMREMKKMVPASVMEAMSRAEKALSELKEKLNPWSSS